MDMWVEPRFLLDKESICYGCSFYKHISDTDAPDEYFPDDLDENGGICDSVLPCYCGSRNDYKVGEQNDSN